MGFLKTLVEDWKFNQKCKKHDKAVAPYIKTHKYNANILNIDKVVEDWGNEWEIIHFSRRHLILSSEGTEDWDSIEIHPSSAKAIIKALGLKKYDLFLQEGKKYRLEEWKPSNKTYCMTV